MNLRVQTINDLSHWSIEVAGKGIIGRKPRTIVASDLNMDALIIKMNAWRLSYDGEVRHIWNSTTGLLTVGLFEDCLPD